MTRHRICLIEDDEIMGESLCDRLGLEGYAFDWYRNGEEAIAGVARQSYSLVLSDFRLPDMDGETLFRRLIASRRMLPPVIFITGYGAIDKAVELLKLGAADYLTKPFDIELLLEKLRELCVAPFANPVDGDAPGLGISPVMQQIQESLPRLAAHASNVLLTGESGVGKERVAQMLHQLAGRPEAPFVAVNCGAISEGLFEAELFGHAKGAFTGAGASRRGVFEQADGGTLFLDEIGEMPLSMQVKLLRVIQERCFVRVGGEVSVKVELKLVCATNRDLKAMVDEGTFREDLYYRINVIQLRIPPLRERREDVLWLAEAFLAECTSRHGGQDRRLSASARQALLDYPWPGNVRELKHCFERACILSQSPTLRAEDLFEVPPLAAPGADADARSLAAYLHDCERAYIAGALERNQRHIVETAADLGISRKNLWEKMKKLGMPGGG